MVEPRSDADILGGVPDFLSIPTMLKSTPREEGGERYLYIEASNEDQDHQGEVVLQKALKDSTDYFLRHGNLDISHYTILGPKMGLSNHMEYEIGKPVEVRPGGARTFVKAHLYKGDSPMARNANIVWDSMTRQTPAKSWFASVGGSTLAKSMRVDPRTQTRVPVIERVRWSNLALDNCPVNASVPEVSTRPIGEFAKAFGGFVLAKTLTAGYGTDSAALTGGAALREQSLDRGVSSYFDFRERLAKALREGSAGSNPGSGELVRFATDSFGLSRAAAAEYVERFLGDLRTHRQSQRSPA